MPKVGENITGAPKMQNNQNTQYWTCFPYRYHSYNFEKAKVVALNLFASFVYRFCKLVHGYFSILLPTYKFSYNYFDSKNCRSFTPLKSDNFRESNQEKKQRADIKNEAKKFKVITLQGALEKSPILR